MNKPIVRVLQAILMSVVCMGSVYAYPVVSIFPAEKFVDGPGNLSISIKIDGLQADDPARLLGAFSLDLLFDPAVLTYLPFPANYWGNALGDVNAGEALPSIDYSTPGVIHLGEVSLLEGYADTCSLCSGPFLEDLQGNNLTLATLRFFTGATSGSTQLQLLNPIFVDANGFPVPLDGLNGATVYVPEPGNMAVYGLVAMLVVWLRRRNPLPSASRRATGPGQQAGGQS